MNWGENESRPGHVAVQAGALLRWYGLHPPAGRSGADRQHDATGADHRWRSWDQETEASAWSPSPLAGSVQL